MDEETAEQRLANSSCTKPPNAMTSSSFVGHYAASHQNAFAVTSLANESSQAQRLQFTALLLQRITSRPRSHDLRLLRLLPERNPPRLRMLMRYRYNHKENSVGIRLYSSNRDHLAAIVSTSAVHPSSAASAGPVCFCHAVCGSLASSHPTHASQEAIRLGVARVQTVSP